MVVSGEPVLIRPTILVPKPRRSAVNVNELLAFVEACAEGSLLVNDHVIDRNGWSEILESDIASQVSRSDLPQNFIQSTDGGVLLEADCISSHSRIEHRNLIDYFAKFCVAKGLAPLEKTQNL